LSLAGRYLGKQWCEIFEKQPPGLLLLIINFAAVGSKTKQASCPVLIKSATGLGTHAPQTESRSALALGCLSVRKLETSLIYFSSHLTIKERCTVIVLRAVKHLSSKSSNTESNVCDGEAFYLVEWENTMIPLGTEHWLSQAVIGDVSLIDLATSCDIVDDMVVVEWQSQWVNVNDLGGAVEAVQRYWLDIVESTRQVNSRLCVTEVMLLQDV
jgi:hypothetical protein